MPRLDYPRQPSGNTVVDALLMTVERLPEPLPEPRDSAPPSRLVLITGHRRENFGSGFEKIFDAILELAERHPDVCFMYPVHLNPRVRSHAHRRLVGKRNIRLIPPVSYPDFVSLMRRATLILTDSGGVQEEAPTFGVPVLVMRDKTERHEAVEAGVAFLVGTQPDSIVREVDDLLRNAPRLAKIAKTPNPFGDGHASERIVSHLSAFGKSDDSGR